MKRLLFIFCILPIISFAQVGKDKSILSTGLQDSVLGTSFVLKENSVVFQKIYSSDLNKAELTERMKEFLPSVKGFQLTGSPNQNEDQFSGKLSDFIVNYRKYGGTLMGTAIVLNYPVSANVIVQVRDNKYRVIIRDVMFKGVKMALNDTGTDLMFDELISKKQRTEIRVSETYLKSARYIDKDFESAFDIHNKTVVKDDF